MPFDPQNPTQMQRLRDSIRFSRDELEPFRAERNECVRQFAGAHYGNHGHPHAGNGAMSEVFSNEIELMVNTFTRAIAASAPRVLVTTKHRQLKRAARDWELATNQQIKEVNLERSMRDAVRDALFGIGVIKVGLDVAAFGEDGGPPLMETFAETVDLDDFVIDMTARKMDEVQYIGNRTYPTEDEIAADPRFKKGVLARAKKQDDVDRTLDDTGFPTAASISMTRGAGQQRELHKRVALLELYLPKDGLVIVMFDDMNESGPPLSEQIWDGPSVGPYHILGFTSVPGNLMPLGPVLTQKGLHDLVNDLYRKAASQARRQANVLVTDAVALDDGRKLGAAQDGSHVVVKNPDKSKEVRIGGIDQTNLAMFLNAKDLFRSNAGNIEALGGLGPQADTVGQEEIIAANVGLRVSDMQEQLAILGRSVVRSMVWYEWTDPVRKRILDVNVRGTSISIQVPWAPSTADGEFLDFNFDIDVFSMAHQTPRMRLNTITNVMQQLILPLMPQITAQGGVIDFDALFRLIGKYTNTESDFEEIIHFFGSETQQGTEFGPVGEPARPAVTNRTTTRITRAGPSTQRGADSILSQNLLGGGQQNQNQAIAGVAAA